MSTVIPFRPRDILPPISMPDSTGQPFDVMQQSIAGKPRILALGRTPPAELCAAAEARGAVVLVVLPRKPDGSRRTQAPQRLHDPDRQVFTALGLPEGGVAVISPRGRLAFAQAGEDAMQAALQVLPTPPAQPSIRRSGAPVLLIPDLIGPEFVADLLAHWHAGEKTAGGTASAAGGAQAAARSIKRRTDVALTDRALYQAFQQRIERRVLPEMWRAWRFRAARFEAPRIGCYDAADAGAFGAHRDNRTPYTAHRRFAMSLNLNTGEYEGGQLRFAEFGPDLYEPGTGGAAIFGCDLLHEALPVTRGRRFAIFTFFTDAEGAEQERRMMAAAAARGESGVALR